MEAAVTVVSVSPTAAFSRIMGESRKAAPARRASPRERYLRAAAQTVSPPARVISRGGIRTAHSSTPPLSHPVRAISQGSRGGLLR